MTPPGPSVARCCVFDIASSPFLRSVLGRLVCDRLLVSYAHRLPPRGTPVGSRISSDPAASLALLFLRQLIRRFYDLLSLYCAHLICLIATATGVLPFEHRACRPLEDFSCLSISL